MGISSGEAPGPWAHVADAQNTSLTAPNPQPQRKTPGSSEKAGCPAFACLLGLRMPWAPHGWR